MAYYSPLFSVLLCPQLCGALYHKTVQKSKIKAQKAQKRFYYEGLEENEGKRVLPQRTYSSIAATKKIYPQMSQILADFLPRKGTRKVSHEFSQIDTDLEGREKAQKAQKRFVTVRGIF